MIIKSKKIKDLIFVNNKSFKDKRGFFKELLKEKDLKKKFPFLVMSFSKKNVIRGLHLQTKNSQGKFITVIKGKIFDVAVDLRKNSKTFGKHYSIVMSHYDEFSFYIPKNFAHGFLCLSDKCTINYKCSDYRNPNHEKTLNWSDQSLKIKWPVKKPILSKRDKINTLSLKDI